MFDENKNSENFVRTDFLDKLFEQYQKRLIDYLNKHKTENIPLSKDKISLEYCKLISSLQPLLNILEYNILHKRIFEDLSKKKLI